MPLVDWRIDGVCADKLRIDGNGQRARAERSGFEGMRTEKVAEGDADLRALDQIDLIGSTVGSIAHIAVSRRVSLPFARR